MKKIIVITGPTGVGKTKLSVKLAKKLKGEIINADSMQVYKGLDIGTAKITEVEKENIPHHLFDICSVHDNYTIYNYQKDAREIINKLQRKSKTPILVGGSGLYIKAALYDYKLVNEDFHSEFEELTNEEILNEIKKNYDTDIHINNRKRLVRELNKIKNNSTNISNINKPIYDIIVIGLTTDRDRLYKIIDNRVEQMVKDGLIREVKDLYDDKINTKAIETGIGYKELYKYFSGELSLNEALDLIKKNSRNFAKRQYTFFNHQMKVNWFNVEFDNFDNTVNEVYDFIMKEE
jgi:tRNA dimethylallyltransferase